LLKLTQVIPSAYLNTAETLKLRLIGNECQAQLAGGRLSSQPRGADWTMSVYATPEHVKSDSKRRTESKLTKRVKAAAKRLARHIPARLGGFMDTLVGWCRLTVSKPVLKAPVLSALETGIS
jgi:hypothetical protein